MKGPVFLLIIILFLTGCASIRPSEPSIPEYTPHVYTAGADTLPYRLLEPAKTGRGELYPLVVFLHGSGERGNDNTRQLTHGTYLFQKPENVQDYPCFVLAPQCPEGNRWVDAAWDSSVHRMPENPSKPLQMVHDLILKLTTSLPVDPDRIYV
ncbi:MAG: phospholipase, partial [Candidatus Neomarinimicrobiota bacterium]